MVEGSRPRYAKRVSRLADLHYQCGVQAGDSKRQRAEAGRKRILTISLYGEGRTSLVEPPTQVLTSISRAGLEVGSRSLLWYHQAFDAT